MLKKKFGKIKNESYPCSIVTNDHPSSFAIGHFLFSLSENCRKKTMNNAIYKLTMKFETGMKVFEEKKKTLRKLNRRKDCFFPKQNNPKMIFQKMRTVVDNEWARISFRLYFDFSLSLTLIPVFLSPHNESVNGTKQK